VRHEIYSRLCSNRYFDPGLGVEWPTNAPALPPPAQTISVVLADGCPLTANGLLNIGSHEGSMAVDGYEFRGKPIADWYDGSNADVLLLDVCMPIPNAVAVVKNLVCRFPDVRIIVLSDEDDAGVIRFMRDLGVCGYHIKTYGIHSTIQTIIKVFEGEKVFPQNLEGGIARLILERFTSVTRPDLSCREIEVLKLIAEGKTNLQIAQALYISPLTVKTHRQHLLQKLNADNTAQLLSKARYKGLL